jgi:hypothetical protein
LPRRPRRQEWEPSIPISVELKGVTHNGHYQFESGSHSKRELRLILVTYDGDSERAHLGGSQPEDLAKLVLSALGGKKRSE